MKKKAGRLETVKKNRQSGNCNKKIGRFLGK